MKLEEIYKIRADRLREIRELLDGVVQDLIEDGVKHAEMFVEAKAASIEDGRRAELSYLITRCRGMNGGISAEWYKNSPITKKNGDIFIKTTYIKKGKHGYTMNTFRNEPDWARSTIADVEGRYRKLREQSQIITSMRRSVKSLERLLAVSRMMWCTMR